MFTIFANWQNKIYMNGYVYGYNDFILLDDLVKNQSIKSISCGLNHCLVYMNTNELWLLIYKEKPKFIVKDSNIKYMICDWYDTIIYKENGELWHYYYYSNNYMQPYKLIMKDISIKIISCGSHHTILYKNDGTLWGFGDNRFGQLGIGHFNRKPEPKLIMKDISIKLISCGSDFTIIYKTDGSLYGFGNNSSNQLGIGSHKLILNDENIKIISCGVDYTILYRNNGEVYGLGSNYYGQLTTNSKILNYDKPILMMKDDSIKAICCNVRHTLIYKENGEIYGIGSDFYAYLNSSNRAFKIELLYTDPTIKFIMNNKIDIKWAPEHHKNYPKEIKDKIFNFLLCHLQSKIKIPKFVRYEIFKFIFN